MVNGRVIPETANRQDWPRLVSQAHKDHEGRLNALEAGGGGGGGAWGSITGTLSSQADLQAALDGKAANFPKGTATITPTGARYEWSETVAAAGVLAGSVVIAALAPALDTDENDPELLDLASLSAMPGVNTLSFEIAFREPSSGPIKINWSAF